MKIYKLRLTTEVDSSVGYVYGASKAWASRTKTKFEREHDSGAAKIEEIKVIPTKQGILDALNEHGGHADNG